MSSARSFAPCGRRPASCHGRRLMFGGRTDRRAAPRAPGSRLEARPVRGRAGTATPRCRGPEAFAGSRRPPSSWPARPVVDGSVAVMMITTLWGDALRVRSRRPMPSIPGSLRSVRMTAGGASAGSPGLLCRRRALDVEALAPRMALRMSSCFRSSSRPGRASGRSCPPPSRPLRRRPWTPPGL